MCLLENEWMSGSTGYLPFGAKSKIDGQNKQMGPHRRMWGVESGIVPRSVLRTV